MAALVQLNKCKSDSGRGGELPQGKAEKAGGLAPTKGDNAVLSEFRPQLGLLLYLFNSNIPD